MTSTENNTFTDKKTIDGDEFETEIGDIKQPNFHPQLKIKRWDNECNFSVRLIDDDPEEPVIETEGNKIKFIKKDRECHFYNKIIQQKTIEEELNEKYERKGECNQCGKCCEKYKCSHYKGNGICDIYENRPQECKDYPTLRDLYSGNVPKECSYYLEKRQNPVKTENPSGNEIDTYEFEVILKGKPKINKIQMSIETKGLIFCYQSELTQKRIDKGDYRPENVVGSYAVYHESKQGDYSKMGGKNYHCGKAFHIYRPKIIDSVGTEVWGELNINTETGILSVEIPQEFLDNAVYPIRHAAGLTFGNTNAGASTETMQSLRGIHDIPASSGDVDNIKAYVNIASGTYSRGAIYDYGFTSKSQLTNGLTPEVNGTGSAGWLTYAYSSKPSVVGSTRYTAVIASGFVGKGVYGTLYNDDVWANDITGTTAFTYPTLPNPSNFTGQNVGRSIYCTYSAGAAADIKTINGLAIASVKTYNGLAIASVKTINGATTS